MSFDLIYCQGTKMLSRTTAYFLSLCIVSACSPVTHNQLPAATVPALQAKNDKAAEINRALGTLAVNTGTGQGSQDYQVGPEDLLQITVFNIPEAEGRVLPRTVTTRVSHQGLVSLPVVGEIKAAGLTLAALERELVKKYEKYIHHPQVGILVTEYRQRVSVIGAAQKTGVFDLSGPKTVIDILAMAGGVTDKAGTQVHIYRQGPNGRESHVIDLLVLASNAALINESNAGLITMPVQAGDVINVPPAGTFFVDGAVKNPGPFALGRRYTLTQALTTAGGVDRELYSADVTIFRRKGQGGMESIPLDLDKILAGSAADPQIEADDVIVVPRSTGKYLLQRFVGQLIGGISIGSFIGGS
jgi:polysaccharide biosynthesis/export protein